MKYSIHFVNECSKETIESSFLRNMPKKLTRYGKLDQKHDNQ